MEQLISRPLAPDGEGFRKYRRDLNFPCPVPAKILQSLEHIWFCNSNAKGKSKIAFKTPLLAKCARGMREPRQRPRSGMDRGG